VNKSNFLFAFFIILSFSIPPILFEQSFAQENQTISPRHQWKQLTDTESLTCKEGLIFLQKINGTPSCVSPTTYLKLVDRGYGKFDSPQLMNRPEMMTHLMVAMVDDSQLMNHWHNMMLNDQKILQKTMDDTVLQLEENQEYISNFLGPMITNSELRKQMIEQMKNHTQMTRSLQGHSGWMDSVHQPMMKSNMGHEINSEMHENTGCPTCSEIKQHDLHANNGFHQPKIMEDLMHHMWINEKMRTQMYNLMLKSPNHMMEDQMMSPLLGLMMDNSEIRNKMIEIMLENQDFMDSIRHENNFSN
jgi:hypothetical protein